MDDVTLVAEYENSLQYQFPHTARKLYHRLLSQKTKTLNVSNEHICFKLQLHDKVIEQVSFLTYLGIQITCYQNIEIEVKHEAIKASRISGCCNSAIWSNQFLRTDASVHIYGALVRPILSYASEIRPDIVKTEQILEATEMKILRRILNLTPLDEERSDYIRVSRK